MTMEQWRNELFELFKKIRTHPSWPENFNQCLTWMDEDAIECLKQFKELDDKGLFNFQ